MELIILLVVVLAIAVVVLVIVNAVRGAIHSVQNSAIGQIAELVQNAEVQTQAEPRSVSGGDRLYLPKILKDFPEFDVSLAKATIEGVIQMLFTGGDEVEETHKALATRLAAKYGSVSEVTVHTTAICGYLKTQTGATIRFQTAFAIKNGSQIHQLRFESEYVLVIDTGKVTESLHCENCGAPLASFGAKVCEFCGSHAKIMQDMAWRVNKISIR